MVLGRFTGTGTQRGHTSRSTYTFLCCLRIFKNRFTLGESSTGRCFTYKNLHEPLVTRGTGRGFEDLSRPKFGGRQEEVRKTRTECATLPYVQQ